MTKKPKKSVPKPKYAEIPKEIELFGRKIKTIDDTERLSIARNFGEALYGVNHIALNMSTLNGKVDDDELKLTYLHEMLHFILTFVGYDEMIRSGTKIDIEQFIELLSAGIYQYEKSAKY